jgi:glyoxylase-like metal-dependent hydrolase (beta-lactamase superfamily II)
MENQGISPESVDFVMITHVHLDHAGGSGSLMKIFPNARLLCHPRAKKHMVDPGRLIQSAKMVYGDLFDDLYGKIEPVSEDRIYTPADSEEMKWGNSVFKFIYTQGHANHHFCIFESLTQSIFTGDSFGIAYPRFGGSFIFPTTTPTDFDAKEAISSLDKIVATGAKVAYLTHFGPIYDLEAARTDLREGIDYLERKRQSIISGKEDLVSKESREEFLKSGVAEWMQILASRKQINFSSEDQKFLEMDIQLNAMGLLFSAEREIGKSGRK